MIRTITFPVIDYAGRQSTLGIRVVGPRSPPILYQHMLPPAPAPLASALALMPEPPDVRAFADSFIRAHASRTGMSWAEAAANLLRHTPPDRAERLAAAVAELAKSRPS